MRRLVLAALVVVLGATPAEPARRHRLHRPPGIVLPRASAVVEREYEIHVTHVHLAAGTMRLNVSNTGEDDHDLTVAGPRGVIGRLLVHPGQRAVLRLTLARGRYRLYCSIADHELLGMRAALAVG